MHTQDTNMAKYEVFHSMGDFFWVALRYDWEISASGLAEAFAQGKYEYVHTFELPAEDIDSQLEQVFFLSQNFERGWHPTAEYRSTSVGDIVRVGDAYYIVAPVGWHLMPNPVRRYGEIAR